MITKKCLNCGREYEVWDYRVDSSKYCSKECMLNHKQVELKCEYCGKLFKRGRTQVHPHNYCSIACKYKDPVFIERVSKSIKASDNPVWKRYWQHINKGKRRAIGTEFKKGWQYTEKGKEMIKKRLKSMIKKPNSKEQMLLELIENAELPYEYIGDGGLLIGSKNPDFIRTDGEKVIIEFYGDYWHNSKNCKYWHQTEEGAREYYGEYGFDLLVIWEKELKEPELLIDKLLNYTGESLTIKAPVKSCQIFEKFADEEFGGNKNFAFKYLVDNLLVQDVRFDEIFALLQDHESRLDSLQSVKDKPPMRRMLSGKLIPIKQ